MRRRIWRRFQLDSPNATALFPKRRVGRKAVRSSTGGAEPNRSTESLVITRRKFLSTTLTAAATAPLLSGLYAWRIEPHWLEVTHRPLPLEGLPDALEGRALVQLSDLHVGAQVDDAFILDTFRIVTALAPDIVVFTGDFITYDGPEQFSQLRRLLAHTPRGGLGTFAILGNHDYGPGWSMLEVADRVTELLTGAQISVLRNEVGNMAGLQVAGVEDLWSGRFDLAAVLARLDPAAPSVVLCHNPDGVDEPGWGGYRGWILSGHTHGGQCRPPFLPPPLLPVKNRRYTAGEFLLSDRRALYVNRGVGHLARVRFNVRPEVTAFRLTKV